MIGSEIVLASVKSQDNATIGYRDTFSIPQQCHKYLRCTGVNFHPLENRPSSESTLIHTCYYLSTMLKNVNASMAFLSRNIYDIHSRCLFLLSLLPV